MGPRGSPSVPCSWDCYDKTQTIFYLVLPYSSTCKAHGLATGAVVCPSKPTSPQEEQRWLWAAEQEDERFSWVWWRWCGIGGGGPAALWAQQGQVGACSRNAFASDLTFSQGSAVLINRFSEELKGKCTCLMRGVSFPQAWDGMRMQPVLEGCMARECSKDWEVQPLLLSTHLRLCWTEWKGKSSLLGDSISLIQVKTLRCYPGLGDPIQVDRGDEAVARTETHTREERGSLPPRVCSAMQTRPPTPDAPCCMHISAPWTSPLTPAHLLQALLYPRG